MQVSFIVVYVPEDDPFCVSKVIAEMRDTGEAAEVFSWFPFYGGWYRAGEFAAFATQQGGGKGNSKKLHSVTA